MEINWEEGFSISVERQDDAVVIRANEAGLRSLANIMTALSQQSRDHIHLDQYNSLEDHSLELIIEKVE